MASCFICVQPLDYSIPISTNSLSELLTISCKLLEIDDISEWQLLESSNVTVCCASCLDCLQKIKQIYDRLQQLQEQLRLCLLKLTSTVKKSGEIKNADVSGWSRGFFKFRSQLTTRPRAVSDSSLYSDEDPLVAVDKSCDDPLKLTQEEEIVPFKNNFDYNGYESTNLQPDLDIVVKLERDSRRKRKIVVIADEDENVSKTSDDKDVSQVVVKQKVQNEDDHEVRRKLKYSGHKLRRRHCYPHPSRYKNADSDASSSNMALRKRDGRRKKRKTNLTNESNSQFINDDTDSDKYASDSSSSWKNDQKKKQRKIKKKPGLLSDGAPGSEVFIPGFTPGKWITCAIHGCKSGWSYKEDWSRHSREKHPGVNYKQVWKEMSTREFMPRRLLHCGFPKCPKFDSRSMYDKHMKAVHPETIKPIIKSSPAPKPANIWNCDMCNEPVPKGHILEHVRSHVGDYAIKCPNPKCIYAFCTVRYYKAHMGNPFRKAGCTPFIGDGPNLDVCELCGQRAHKSQGLRRHMEMAHERGDSKPFSCPVEGCSETFTHRQTVQFHISFRHSAPLKRNLMPAPNSQLCPECSTSFPHDEIVGHFIDSHKVPLESIVSCQHCPYKAPSKEQLLNHFIVHFREGMALACDICTEDPIPRFSRLGGLRRHYLEVHQIGESFICEYCSKAYLFKDHLESHIAKLHSGNPKYRNVKKFTCDLCVEEDPVKYTQAGVIRHKILVHGLEPYKCPSCPKTFTSWALLSLHKKAHKNVTRAKYPCDIPGCGLICISPADLARHRACVKHSGRTNAFVCQDCGAGFNTEKAMKTHRKLHAEVKKFVCDVCGRGYVAPASLATHVRTHTGERPFECSICSNRYNDKSHLRRHMKTKHPNSIPT